MAYTAYKILGVGLLVSALFYAALSLEHVSGLLIDYPTSIMLICFGLICLMLVNAVRKGPQHARMPVFLEPYVHRLYSYGTILRFAAVILLIGGIAALIGILLLVSLTWTAIDTLI